MEFTLLTFLILVTIALICEFIDASMGMLYGTILSPVLIIAGLDPLIVVPSILLSQAAGGLIASTLHHRLKNAEFKIKAKHPKTIVRKVRELGWLGTLRKGLSEDLRVVFCIVGLGIIVTVLSALVAINIPKVALKTYIGVLVLVMGIILISRIRFKYTWKKMVGVGILSAFNKGLSGGGFGPVTTAGPLIVGRGGRRSIGVTTLAKATICLAGFLT